MAKHNLYYRVFIFLICVNSFLILLFTHVTIFLSDDKANHIILTLLLVANLIGSGLLSIYHLLELILNELKKRNN